MNNQILAFGGHPPQPGVLQNLSDEGVLLFAAWAHGMTAGDVVHRYTLFAYVQTHIINNSEEHLQNTLENSVYWSGVGSGNGKYELTQTGFNLIVSEFGSLPKKSDLKSKYLFTRNYLQHEFSVLVDPRSRKLTAIIDGDEYKGVDACRFLEQLGASFVTNSNSKNAKLLNWIIQDNDFTWIRDPQVV